MEKRITEGQGCRKREKDTKKATKGGKEDKRNQYKNIDGKGQGKRGERREGGQKQRGEI